MKSALDWWFFAVAVLFVSVIAYGAYNWIQVGARDPTLRVLKSQMEDRYTQIQNEVHAWLVRNDCKRTGYAGNDPVAVFTCSDGQVWTAYDVRRELGL